MTTLLVRGSADTELDAWSWAQLDTAGKVIAEGYLATRPPISHQICLVLPDAQVSYAQVKLPEGRLRKSVSALTYAVEDSVIDEVDGLHVVLIDADGNDSLSRVAMIKKALLGDMIHRLCEKGLDPDCAIPEAFLGSVGLDTWTVQWASENCILRIGSTEVVSLDEPTNQLPPQLLLLKLKEATELGKLPLQIEILADDSDSIDRFAWASSLQLPLRWGGRPDWRRIPQKQGRVGNLLEGEFRPPRKVSFDWLDRIRAPAMSFVLIGAIGLAAYSIYAGKLLVEKLVLESRMQAIFNDLFPDAAPSPNPAQTMRRNLADLRHRSGLQDPTDLIPTLSRIVDATKNVKGGVRNLNYQDGQLEFDVVFPNADSLAENSNAIRASGIDIAVLDVQPSGAGQQAKIAINLEKAKR